MIGILEVALFLTPFVAFLAWRVLSPHLPAVTVWIAVAALVLIALGGAWTASRPHLEHGQRYAPPEWRNGEIVPGRAVDK